MTIGKLIRFAEARCGDPSLVRWLRTLNPGADASVAWGVSLRGDRLMRLCEAAFDGFTPAMRLVVIKCVRELAMPHAQQRTSVVAETLNIAERFVNGNATIEEMSDASATAMHVALAFERMVSVSGSDAGRWSVQWQNDEHRAASCAASAAGHAASRRIGSPASAITDAVYSGIHGGDYEAQAKAAEIVRAHIRWNDVQKAMEAQA